MVPTVARYGQIWTAGKRLKLLKFLSRYYPIEGFQSGDTFRSALVAGFFGLRCHPPSVREIYQPHHIGSIDSVGFARTRQLNRASI
jgi:hypothetical protein